MITNCGLMVFIETPVFTRQVLGLLTDEEYGRLQFCLAAHPKMGRVIQGTGGLRKARWTDERGGKSGGVRVIYCHVAVSSQCRMLLIYRKGMKDDLTAAEKRTLRKLNENW
jgi:hypothetical protein